MRNHMETANIYEEVNINYSEGKNKWRWFYFT